MQVRGVLHMHSTHSYDGKLSLLELKQFLLEQDISFCCMTEHTDELDAQKAAKFVQECQELSDECFVFVPGFEVPYKNAHVLYIGTTSFVSTFANVQQLRQWREKTPLVILAHPVRNNFDVDEHLLSVIDGVEVWNQQYEGKIVPRVHSIQLLQKIQKQKQGLQATGGLDFHRSEHFGSPLVTLTVETMSVDSIVRALQKGAYVFGNDVVTVSAEGVVKGGLTLSIRMKSMLSIVTINAGKFVNKILAWVHISLPKSLKQIIRSKV